VTTVPSSLAELEPEELQLQKLFNSRCIDSVGSFAMNVNGSVSPVEFVLEPGIDLVLINEVRLVFHSTNMNIESNESRRFGAATAPNTPLPNGIEFVVVQAGVQTNPLLEPVTVIGDFIRYADTDGIINNVDAIAAGTDLLMVVVTTNIPIALLPFTGDKLSITINDDLTSLALFETQVSGTRIVRTV
jgi:hypothetical protein